MRTIQACLVLSFILVQGCGVYGDMKSEESDEPVSLVPVENVVPGWNGISNPYFSFQLPAGFEKSDVRGIDSFVEEYRSENMVLRFDYGMWSNNFSGWPQNTKFESATIDGRAAKIGFAADSFGHPHPLSTQVYFASVYSKKNASKLSMFVSCSSEADIELAHQIFRTIRFAQE